MVRTSDNRTRVMSLVVLGLAAAVACSTPAAPPSAGGAQSAPGTAAPPQIVPAVSVNAMMVALVDHAAHNLWDVEREGAAPRTDADWEVVAEHAIQMVAAGTAITTGGTGPSDAMWARNPAWRAHAQKMADAGAAALAATQNRNLQEVIRANGLLVESCEGCHKEFKPDMPTEGIVHGHAHAGTGGDAKRPPD